MTAEEDARTALRTMRETRRCDPPGHAWSSETGLKVGDPCQCGEVVMTGGMRAALDWRCEP